jgi:hypothetical protein
MITLFYLAISSLIWAILLTGLFVGIMMSIYSDTTVRKNQIIIAAAIGDVFIGLGLMNMFLEGYFLIV